MCRAYQWTGQVSALEYIKTQFQSDPSRFRAGYVHQSLFILENETHGIFASVPSTFIYQHFATIMGDDVHPLPPFIQVPKRKCMRLRSNKLDLERTPYMYSVSPLNIT
ncbi:uncharacterized protein Bfra_001574 [Botrytis fragariae]|uniref:Uncharacterized protein n=1 Tax=Botrytis fragariae TaxID=1964551 RepID=A0A8H6B0N0_9HELO|nr:uncharacterized protein Bfra_001574 [Botrytis fragariae]KAF5877209.1 hypothetical protein Bfra_001574 [Botrytis fragariae]